MNKQYALVTQWLGLRYPTHNREVVVRHPAFNCQVTTMASSSRSHTFASVTKYCNLVQAKKRRSSAAAKVTADLAKSNGSLPPGL